MSQTQKTAAHFKGVGAAPGRALIPSSRRRFAGTTDDPPPSQKNIGGAGSRGTGAGPRVDTLRASKYFRVRELGSEPGPFTGVRAFWALEAACADHRTSSRPQAESQVPVNGPRYSRRSTVFPWLRKYFTRYPLTGRWEVFARDCWKVEGHRNGALPWPPKPCGAQ